MFHQPQQSKDLPKGELVSSFPSPCPHNYIIQTDIIKVFIFLVGRYRLVFMLPQVVGLTVRIQRDGTSLVVQWL